MAGVALARVRTGDIAREGLADNGPFLGGGVGRVGSGRKAVAKSFDDWQDCLAQWEVRLGAIMDEYRSGDCSFRLFRKKALDHAGLDLLLREGPSRRWLNLEESDDE